MLSCPACGARNIHTPGSPSIKCSYCGTSYVISAEVASRLHTTYYQCPKCHQDDRVEKVSTIISKEVTHTHGMSMQTAFSLNSKGGLSPNIIPGSYNSVQSSDLAKKLKNPPSSPQLSRTSKPIPFDINKYEVSGRNLKVYSYVILSVIGACGLTPFILGINSDSLSTSPYYCLICFLLLGLLFAVPCWLLGDHRQNIKKNSEKIKIKEQNYLEQLNNYNNAIDTNNKKQANYQKAMNNWSNLYYCFRDDCVFVPGAGKSAPASQFQVYLYEV